MKREPITDIRAEVQDFVRFLREIGEASLETKNLPEREALQRAVQKLGPCAESLIGIIEKSGIPEDVQEVALLNLWSALASAFMIGSHGTASKNTKAVGTAAGRSKAAEKREPKLELMTKLITAAEKVSPPGHGHATAVHNHVRVEMKKLGYDVSEKTISRYRKLKIGTS